MIKIALLIVLSYVSLLEEGVEASGFDIHISFHHEETFEVQETVEVEDSWAGLIRETHSVNHLVQRPWWEASRKLMSAPPGGGQSAEVIDMTKRHPGRKKTKGTFFEEAKRMASLATVPLLGLGVVLVIICYYMACIKKKLCLCWCELLPCCYGLHPEKLARKGVNKYVPGVVVHEGQGPGGKVSVSHYEVTDRERDAMENFLIEME